MGYALLSHLVIYSNHCPSASMGWLVIGEEMAHWLAGARQKNVTALCVYGPYYTMQGQHRELGNGTLMHD